VTYPGGHRLCGDEGHSSQGLPQATPILPQHSDLVTKAWALFSQRPLLTSNQHDPFLLSKSCNKCYHLIHKICLTIQNAICTAAYFIHTDVLNCMYIL
jgi:hypothetical protein